MTNFSVSVSTADLGSKQWTYCVQLIGRKLTKNGLCVDSKRWKQRGPLFTSTNGRSVIGEDFNTVIVDNIFSIFATVIMLPFRPPYGVFGTLLDIVGVSS